ncbi:NAD(P)/FAD-dependent oxidoreductase [Paremcibacter congregatus]|uniref:FAD-dependent oxidoreductase n=1 Tax=Paremcibacter congregatus TaxID=2043170 RepID=A0A2G4YSA1_9PROT|nr:FAD-binding oxidoreductase [Paremcibacter congregatus]PHZ85219.1 FAD-dependent oxidoreductase [Paremcibacter congregatus]QDE27848.1 FAD-binding oxidoreductase [Paremcibacter congregatus]
MIDNHGPQPSDFDQHPKSYYVDTANRQSTYPRIDGDQTCDICVVGGGFTGLSSALHLKELGYDVILLEARKIGWGASGRNGGQLGSGQRVGQDTLEKLTGKDGARLLWDLGEDSKQLVKDLIAKHNISCDLKPGVLHTAHKKHYQDDYRQEAEKLQTHYDYDQIRFVDADEMADMLGMRSYHGGTLDMGAAHLHPLNLALGLGDACAKAGVRLHEYSPVSSYEEKDRITLHTPTGRVVADQIVLGCNGYLGNLEPRLAGKIMPINNFIVATEPLSEERARQINRDDVAVADSKFVINYFRMSADHRLLFGGGENYTPGFPKDIAGFVRKYMLEIYPSLDDVAIDYAWGGALAITMNRLPHIGKLGQNIYYGQGFSGHGVGMATLAGKIMAEAIHGQQDNFDVFANLPTYPFPGGRHLRWPMMVLGMMYYAIRDRI